VEKQIRYRLTRESSPKSAIINLIALSWFLWLKIKVKLTVYKSLGIAYTLLIPNKQRRYNMKTLKSIKAKRQELWNEGKDDEAHGYTNLLGDIGRSLGGLKGEYIIGTLKFQETSSEKWGNEECTMYDEPERNKEYQMTHMYRAIAIKWFFKD